LNRFIVALMGIAGAGLWLLSGSSARSAAQQSAPSVQYLEGNAFQKERAYSPAVINQGG
jgi:hypothetical protein